MEKTITRKETHIPSDEWDRVERLITYAHKAGLIKVPTWQDFSIFAINVAYSYLKNYDQQRRGLT